MYNLKYNYTIFRYTVQISLKGENMSRKNNLKKTKYTSIYEIIADDTTKQFIARFSYLGKNYGERNFSNLFGVRTAKQAFEKLQEVKVDIAKYGNNPFQKKVKLTLNAQFEVFIETKINKTKYGNKYHLTSSYNKLLKDTLGDKDIDEITHIHIQNLLDKNMKGLSNRRKIDVRNILKPIFLKAIKDEIIKHNPIDDVTFEKPNIKSEITYRVVTNLEEVVQELYQVIMKLTNVEDKIILLIGLMLARRRGEISKLDYSYIKDDKIFVPTIITKTATTDEYPLPIEVLNLIPQLKTYQKGTKNKEGQLFLFNSQRPSYQFEKIVKSSSIEFTEDNNITFHDTRNLFSSIMSPITSNPPLVDRCLSHSQSSIMTTYMSFGYESRKEVFEKYWDIVRG